MNDSGTSKNDNQPELSDGIPDTGMRNFRQILPKNAIMAKKKCREKVLKNPNFQFPYPVFFQYKNVKILNTPTPTFSYTISNNVAYCKKTFLTNM